MYLRCLEHPIIYLKQYYLNNQIKDKIWLEIAKQLGYDKDGIVFDMHLLMLYVAHGMGLATTASVSITFGIL